MSSKKGAYKLTAKQVQSFKKPGAYEDGNGLRLVVHEGGSRNWVLRVQVNGKRTSAGLGAYPEVTLENARELAALRRKAIKCGDEAPRVKIAGRASIAANAVTFRMAFSNFFEKREKELTNPKHRQQWRNTMATYAYPVIGDKAVADVTGPDIETILRPIWMEKPETARRVLQRLTEIFDAAIFHRWRTTANPCTGVRQVLAKKRPEAKHHRAMPYADVPAFITKLREFPSWPETRLALEFLILTASRSGEIRGARWDEVDAEKGIWTIPANRMKRRKPHAVPLSPRCLEILKEAKALKRRSVLIFPSQEGGVLSDMTFTKLLRDQGYGNVATAHGFRSSFRDWCAEVAKVDEDVAEAALAHVVRDKVKAAYKRTQFLEERRTLMALWATYIVSAAAGAKTKRALGRDPSA